MVGKLIKREMKDSVKYYGPVQILILVLFVSMGLMIRSIEMDSGSNFTNIFVMISMLAIVAVSFGLMILSLLANIYIVYTSMYGDRGYDLFTLPVTSMQIIISKILTIVIWSLISFVTAMVGIFVFLVIVGQLSNFMYGVGLIFKNFDVIFAGIAEDFGSIVLFLVDLLVAWIFGSVLMLFAGAAVNTSRIQKNRGLFAVLIYYLISTVTSLATNYGLMFMSSSQLYFNTTTTVAAMVFKIALMGILLYGTKWFWEKKLEIL